ncbi:aldehyde dehydrogenase family protein [Nakamurella endophytica]|uniref:Aldehyde dehydrogenase n=1 Tax=Nakamurella endophytica TaxID=1748367 RepID=A0A917WF34_9ACTN|nr:aldehyde dehydrogenase family protein [Nakamurella endophytica]GGL97517.1 aldehyde dehydrogenase [Nakamurella endophytica]
MSTIEIDRIVVRDKATGESLGDTPAGTADDVDAAVRTAAAAQSGWAESAPAARAAVLLAAAAAFEADRERLRRLLVRETGCIAGKADYEIDAAISELHEAAALTSQPLGAVLPTSHPGRLSYSRQVPVGVVGVLTPWNFPLVLAMRVVGPALALGNAVVLKPSPETPLSGGSAIADAFAVAGLPDGLLKVLPGRQEAGEAVVAHPLVSMVHFTGSTRVGREIAATCGQLLKKVSLELGGNNALVVLEDADIDTAAMIGAWSSFHYQGQTCISAGRHIVHRSVLDAYVADLQRRAESIAVGDTTDPAMGLGPMINRTQFDRGAQLLRDAEAAGATVHTGGPDTAPFFRPAVVTGVTPDMALWREEIFAPVVAVLPFETDDEAITLVNDTSYGLVNSIVTRDVTRGLRMADRLHAGMVHINDATPQDEAIAPFGGIGHSGLGGRSGGVANVAEFTETRWYTVATAPVHYPY